MRILLHDHIAAAGKCVIFVADKDSFDGFVAPRILRAIDKSKKITIIEIAKSVHFIDWSNSVTDSSHNLRSKLEAQIHALGANMKQQVAGCGDRMPGACPNFSKRMKFRWARQTKHLIPRIRSETQNTRKTCFDIARFDRAHNSGKFSAKRANPLEMLKSRV